MDHRRMRAREDTSPRGLLTEEALLLVRELVEVAVELEAAPAAVALSWALGRPDITAVINGAARSEQMTENLAAADLVLPDAAR
jgi:aryl-alcohol dehydrogenase-like predicted oxidoreductase